ncbi:hypothetical protein [Sulfuracidifex tepidarius]|uniref:Uncharacterized protein n=1 Tax=Sulfuracidifex tepidarius TaxID=1294262 RepID=A0A510E2Z3_9CREN|nr:hypothetical protein [Sulfuracidifex tepidarius]BBG24127.1 hypothetical protein IC006_1429 [Sulfuracidifex tepidarius]BBG26883.1 hypothetical protein IC007_1405 [Sulfuracidifex tepidarius]
MKKSTLLMLLQNIYEDVDYCSCFAAKKKLEWLIKKLQEEDIENDS